MVELGTGKSVVVLAIVIGCFSILWPKIFYPMMQTALSITAPKYDAEDALSCQFLLDADTTGYAFFARLCDQLAVRESFAHPRLRGPPRQEEIQEQREIKEETADLPEGLMGRCQTALSAVCRLDLRPSLEAQTLKELESLERDRKVELDQCLLELLKTRQKRKRVRKRKVVNTWEIQSRQPPHLHLPPRMREAMGEARPDLPPFHPSSHQGAQHRIHPGHPQLTKDGRPFPHPSSRQPPKTQPKTGGAMSFVMPIYTIGIVGFFLYTILKLLFKKRNDQPDTNPITTNYHMDPNYHRYVLGSDAPSSIIQQHQYQQTISPSTSGSSKTFINESKTKRYLEEFGKQKVIGSLKTLISQMQNYDLPSAEGQGASDSQDTAKQEEVDVPDMQLPLEKTETLDEELNQKEASSNSSPDTESYELIASPQEDSGKSESEGSEKSAPVTSNTIRQRIAHDSTDDGKTRSYKFSDILQF